jgi:riboflavin kinase/FMN adenylyltransferase
VKTLERAGARTGRFEVRVVPPVTRGGRAVSSSLIRGLLLSGDVGRAATLLGRPYELRGRVVRGAALGRRLGFPTANIRPENEILPPGIFLSLTSVGGRERASLTYIGRRPTLGPGGSGPSVETYLLRWGEPLYGRELTVRLLQRLRSDRKFPDAAGLAAQIRRDVSRAESFFLRRPGRR